MSEALYPSSQSRFSRTESQSQSVMFHLADDVFCNPVQRTFAYIHQASSQTQSLSSDWVCPHTPQRLRVTNHKGIHHDNLIYMGKNKFSNSLRNLPQKIILWSLNQVFRSTCTDSGAAGLSYHDNFTSKFSRHSHSPFTGIQQHNAYKFWRYNEVESTKYEALIW